MNCTLRHSVTLYVLYSTSRDGLAQGCMTRVQLPAEEMKGFLFLFCGPPRLLSDGYRGSYPVDKAAGA